MSRADRPDRSAPDRPPAPRRSRRVAALVLGIPALLVVVACLAMLARSALIARAQAPEEEQRVAELQEQAQTDAAAAVALADEHERQSEAMRARRAKDERVAVVLILAAAAFIGSTKWLLTAKPRPAPPMHRLVPLRVLVTEAAGAAGPAPGAAPADDTDVAIVDEIVAREGRGREAAIPILQAIQAHYRYLPDAALERVCTLTEITPAQIAGTSSFYARFRRSPVGERVVRICHGTACHVAGARLITDELRRYLAIPDDADTDLNRRFTMDEVACLGCCSQAPVLMIDDRTAGKLTPATARDALEDAEREAPT
ncbi:MAG: NADH-quinone oxidoreductase subunit NuoE family protein [Planctomycetota bacterium]|jgi:NADH:ubiquinone oxidoreductase subunit E